MAETHELRLKIDAAAAKRGSREFTAAVNAVKLAVRDLERDSTGAFTQLRKNLDALSKHGKIKVGVDRQAIRDLDSYAKAQRQIVSSTQASTKGIKTLVQTMRGLSDSYAMARKTSEAFASSILKTNSALNRQIQLASQARSAVRQVRTAPSGDAGVSVSGASAKTVRALDAELARLQKSAAAANNALAKAFNDADRGARKATDSAQRHNAALSRMENLQLSAAAAIRSSEREAVRLAARLNQIGDTRGATAVNQALIQLKARLAGGVGSALELRRAMDQFSRSTSDARINITRFNASQAAAASESKRFAAAQRDAANAARRTEREMRSLAGANNAAQQAMARATGGMRGLENAFSATFQAGSLFRTMLGSITFGTFTSSVFKAGDAMQQFMVSMDIATGSAAGAMAEMDYVDNIASGLGINLQTARDNYSKFAISANIAGVAASQTQKIFESVSTAMSVLGKSTEDQNLAFLALEQMMSKGKVSSEELRRQLGERLPGAVNMMAQALGVGMDELQDMLKLGEINSADALPKFADVLQKRFGPGVEAASRRAGNNLQKLRNEITKFLEVVAQSGFIQELAIQFRTLTDQLAGGDGVSAARRLGEALANMAQIGGQAASFLIENIDGIGKALKAVGVGIVVRQVLLLGGAMTTAAQQVSGYAASWLGSRNATTAADAATIKLTAALTANTAALTGNSAAAQRSALSSANFARSQEVATRQALTARRSMVGLGGAMGALGGFAAATATKMGALSRGLSVIAPVAGLAITALLLFPGALDAVGLGSDGMAGKVDAALARAGAAFDEFEEVVRQTASQAELTRLIGDLNTLEAAADRLANAGEGRGGLMGMFVMDDELALVSAVSQLDKDFPSLISKALDFGRIISGYGAFDQDAIGAGAAKAAQALMTGYVDLSKGQGDAVELQKQLNDAMARYPSAAPLFREFEGLISRQVQLEQGIANTTDSLTRLFGTENERMALEFAEAAKQVLKTGEGIDDLNEKQKVLSEISPEVGKRIGEMREEFNRAFAANQSPIEFHQSIQRYYSASADEIKRLRDEVAATEKAFGEATNSLMGGLPEALNKLSSIDISEGMFSGFDGIDGEVIANFENLFNKFAEFQSSGGMQVSAEAVQNYANALQTASPAAAMFRDELISQFSALTSAEQTYQRLDSIMLNLKSKYPEASAEIDTMTQAVLRNARGSNEGALAYSELARKVLSINWPDDEARQTAMEMLGLASNTQAAGNAADTAAGQQYAAADGANAIGASAAAASAEVRALQAALQAMGAVGADFASKGAEIADDLRFQAKLISIPIYEREAARFAREATKAVDKEFDAALASLPESDRSGGPVYQKVMADREAALKLALSPLDEIREAALSEYNATPWEDPKKKRSGGGGGGRGRKEQLSDEQKALEDLNKSLKDRYQSLMIERQALDLVASGQFKTTEAAELMAEAMLNSTGGVDAQTAAMIRQIDAAAALNEELMVLANDPVKKWMDSVPNWIEAGQQIEMGAINHLKDAISNFIQTGKFDIEALGDAILGTIADIVADKAVAELANLLGRGEGEGLGGLLGGLFSSAGDEAPVTGEGAAVAQGGVQAGQSISQAMIQAGQQVSQSISSAMMQGGMQAGQETRMAHMQGGQQAANATRVAGIQHGAQVRTATMTSGNQHANVVKTAITTGGAQHAQMVGAASAGGAMGGAGGMLSQLGGVGGLLSMAAGFFSEGGVSTSPVASGSVPAAAFRSAPHFSKGTTNTSGIPAVLHPNEAVIPLSGGRKIPVDLGSEGGGSGGNKVVNQTFHINTPDADSFRRSQKQIAADGASAAQRAMSSNR